MGICRPARGGVATFLAMSTTRARTVPATQAWVTPEIDSRHLLTKRGGTTRSREDPPPSSASRVWICASAEWRPVAVREDVRALRDHFVRVTL